jgi:Domain of unknown function (DUF4265)
MNISPENQQTVKILFRFHSELLDQEVVEIIRAETVNPDMGEYRIQDIPFYTPNIATEDIVHATYNDDEEMLVYQETLTSSGNSIVWVVITDDDTVIEDVQEIFLDLECDSEEVSERFFAMEVKPSNNYLRIRDKLIALKSEGIIDFAEPCLSLVHQY